MAARTIIIGDVHGMLPELRALLDACQVQHCDHLVFAGDLLDKGPDSAGVVRHVRELRDEGFHVTLVLGNHEDMHAKYRLALSKGARPKMKRAEEIAEIHSKLSAEDIAFLDTATPFVRLPEHEALVVHAGIPPLFEALPRDPANALPEVTNMITRIRFVRASPKVTYTLEVSVSEDDPAHEEDPLQLFTEYDGHIDISLLKKRLIPAGAFISLGQEEPEDPFWAEVYDGRFGHVYFGHNPFLGEQEPVGFPHATGLDLGCVFGGRLAAAILQEGQPPQYVSVPASGKFATPLWER